jgi:solute carrier family 25 carnitine/acylcarnitine transporter 20/29
MNDLDPRLHGFAAGIIAGAAGVCVGHPFDTLKVIRQVTSKANPNLNLNLRSSSLAAVNSYKSSFFLRTLHLYRGVLPPLVSTGIVQSLNFGVYENTRHYLYPRNSTLSGVDEDSPLWSITAAAFISGAATSPLTAIVTKFKLLQQVKGVSLLNIVGDIRSLHPFRYYPLHLILESFGRAVYMTTYAYSKRAVESSGYDNNELGWRVACGATSGVVAWTSIYPLDVLRSRLFSSGEQQDGIVTSFKMLQKEGAMFRGLGFTLVRAAPVAGVVLTCYDVVLDVIRGR